MMTCFSVIIGAGTDRRSWTMIVDGGLRWAGWLEIFNGGRLDVY